MDITQSAVAKWETGETSPRAALLPKLAKVLGCTIDELMADGEESEENKGQIGREENAETERQ